MEKLYAFSGLWRPISLTSFTNRLVLICVASALLFAGGLHYYLTGADTTEAVAYGIRIGLAVFLSWALARELQPDAPWAAFVALGVATVGLWYWSYPDVGALLLLLLVLRLINRSTGVPATLPDVLLLLALTGWILYLGQIWAGVLTAAGFWFNSKLPEPQPTHKYPALLTSVSTISLLAINPLFGLPGNISISTNILTIALATGFALLIRGRKSINSLGDASGTPLNLQRLRTAQMVALLSVTVFTLWQGDSFFGKLSPAWAAFGGIFLYACFVRTPAKV